MVMREGGSPAFHPTMNPDADNPSGGANVTQKMVAAHAGVSQSTVSHILGGFAHRYNKQTGEKVLQAAQAMGYHPNRAAQTMRRGRSNTIVHLNYGGYSELAGQRSYHLGRFVHEAGFDYEVIDSYWWPEKGELIIRRILSLQPEGVVVSGALQTPIDFENLRAAGIPIVSIEPRVAGVSRVHHDVRGAIRELTLECFAQGRNPALLLQKNPADVLRPYWSTMARREGFLDALRERGFDNIPEIMMDGSCTVEAGGSPFIIWNTKETTPSALFERGEHVARWLLGAGRLPDALICSNDFYAIGVMGVLEQEGIRIPEDIAITGFDNLSYSMQQAVGLTTVEQPIEAICKEAVALLKSQIGTGTTPSGENKKIFPCHIHWRRSLPRKSPSPVADESAVAPA